MKLYEFEGKILLDRVGISVPRGAVVRTVEEAIRAGSEIGYPVVLKSQVLRGGRGKAGAIRFADNEADLVRESSTLFSLTIQDEKVNTLLLEKKIAGTSEFYAGITLDPRALHPVLIICKEGGMDIEDLSQHYPGSLLTKKINPLEKPTLEELIDWVSQAGFQGELISAISTVLMKLVNAYFRFEAITAEVNPLILSEGHQLYAGDAKFEIDDSALGRLKEAEFFIRDKRSTDLLEQEALKEGISYVKMDQGNIGLISGGAGLGMATMDMISAHGGRPANFLDLGGNATEEKTAAALRIVLRTQGVKGVLINVFGGINNCEKMARGILRVIDDVHPTQSVPTQNIVVKMRGHSQDEGWALLESRRIPIIKFGTTEEAVRLLIEKINEQEEVSNGHIG